ncbi:MAG TPA: zinc-binding dehydrogenase [Acidimicrobiales bacterium]|nr:zinc-binding dehydrogenase [Acidimicrobiales bacterium]
MRALVLKDFGRCEVESRPDPNPGPGEVTLRIIATGICGSDIHGFTGRNGRRFPGQIMGHESVGRIETLGEGASDFGLAIGDLATFNPLVIPEEDVVAFEGREQHSPRKWVIGVAPDYVAGFAQIVVVPARNVVVLPSTTPPTLGALIEPLAVALHAVNRASVRPGDHVLVVGGGPIGQCVAGAALRNGAAEVIVSELDEGRRALCERLGAKTLNPAGVAVTEEVRSAWPGLADVAIDAVGLSGTLRDALLATKLGGTVCLVGMGSPELQLDPYRISTDERNLVGSFAYSSSEFRDAAQWVANGEFDVSALISREVPLQDANEAFVGLAQMDGTAGKVLVRLDQ